MRWGRPGTPPLLTQQHSRQVGARGFPRPRHLQQQRQEHRLSHSQHLPTLALGVLCLLTGQRRCSSCRRWDSPQSSAWRRCGRPTATRRWRRQYCSVCLTETGAIVAVALRQTQRSVLTQFAAVRCKPVCSCGHTLLLYVTYSTALRLINAHAKPNWRLTDMNIARMYLNSAQADQPRKPTRDSKGIQAFGCRDSVAIRQPQATEQICSARRI